MLNKTTVIKLTLIVKLITNQANSYIFVFHHETVL